MAELARLKERLESFEALEQDIEALAELAEEVDEAELAEEEKGLLERLERLELELTLTEPEDAKNAILSVHPGAGGTESQDWAEMLFRMYLRWAEREGFKVRVLDIQRGEEAGIKDATVIIEGPYAYGLLKAERGVHRLVRISPFDASRRRHTSFASVFVYPEVEDVEVEIKPSEIKIETFRASGPGGQHMQKNDTAVRITHLPTGIVVTCQSERSQHQNKENALRILRARLYELKKKEQEERLQELVGEKSDIAWGHQIRSYVLHPYKLVKDHRTGYESTNPDEVLDGGITPFIRAYLLSKKK